LEQLSSFRSGAVGILIRRPIRMMGVGHSSLRKRQALKRQMFGRASLDLLRKRILLST
jgi:hypothetical protein